MNVVCHDPHVSADVAWQIDGKHIQRVDSVREIAQRSDYVSIHVPFIAGVTENLIGDDFFLHMKVRMLLFCECEAFGDSKNCFFFVLQPNTHILNFARGGIVDSAAYRKVLDAGATSR